MSSPGGDGREAGHEAGDERAGRGLVELVGAALDADDPLTPEQAVLGADPVELERLHHAQARASSPGSAAGGEGGDGAATGPDLYAVGLGASPGVASGVVVFDTWRALDRIDEGDDVILVRPDTSPADEPALAEAVGVVTARGGMSSHAAVVARGRGLPAVCGAVGLVIGDDQMANEQGVVVAEGDRITIDGSTGEVRLGHTEVAGVEVPDQVEVLLGWADARRRSGRARPLAVRANADTPDDARRAVELGAEGIGLCRTEHQFLGARLALLQDAILAEGPEAARPALDALEAAQRADFEALLEVMDGRPVTVRLLDPPLHEFLPDLVELSVAEARGELDPGGLERLAAARRWREHNPMMGVRGVRLAVRRPAIARLQLRALLSACAARRQAGGDPRPQVLVPMVSAPAEVRLVRTWAEEVAVELGVEAPPLGAMVETPRAALLAGELAAECDLLSFGTNDLTQLVFGFSRDDVGPLLGDYLDAGLIEADPFATLDAGAVAPLVASAVQAARAVKPDVPIGVCGEHAGDPASIRLLVAAGVDSISCSPLRLPVARLAAAQAVLAG